MSIADEPADVDSRARTEVGWRRAATFVLLGMVCLPWLILHGEALWARSHYQFTPLLLVGALMLAWRDWQTTGPLQPGPRWVALALLGLAWVLFLAATLLYSPWLGMIATLILAAGLIGDMGGKQLFTTLAPAWFLLWLAVPPPFGWDRNLVVGLQTLTARWTSNVLDVLGVFHVLTGNVVEVAGEKLLVEEACSGIRSLFAVLACTLLFVLWTHRSWVRGVLLLASAVIWVLVANVTRVTLVAWFLDRWDLDMSQGWQHDILGYCLFLLTLGLVWSTDRLWLFFRIRLPVPPPQSLDEDGEEPEAASPAGEGDPEFDRLESPARAPWATLPTSKRFMLVWGVLALLQVGVWWPAADSTWQARRRMISNFDSLEAAALPAQIGPWRRQGFEIKRRDRDNIQGEYSRTWSYRYGNLTALISLDYPFLGWHDLTVCYHQLGWEVVDQETSNDPAHLVEVSMSKPLARHAYLCYRMLDKHGDPLPSSRGVSGLLSRRLENPATLLGRLRQQGQDVPLPYRPSFQVQAIAESPFPLKPTDRDQIRELRQYAEGIFQVQIENEASGR